MTNTIVYCYIIAQHFQLKKVTNKNSTEICLIITIEKHYMYMKLNTSNSTTKILQDIE